MPRFVVLTHDWPELHWDFMLEKEAALRSWRLSRPADSPEPVSAEPIAPHRLAYLEYEGPVSGNRGHVARWDRGEFQLLTDNADFIEVELLGERLKGRAALRQEPDGTGWRFYFTASSSRSSSDSRS